MTMRRKIWSRAAVCGLMAVAAWADGPVTNNEIVVTGSRTRREAARMPADVVVITSDDMRAAGDANVVAALDRVDGMVIRSVAGNPATSEVSLRGFGENPQGRVLILLDGRRMNRPDMAGIDWLEVPLSSVDRIEVVKGSSTVLYGDNALAGVINIITRRGAGGDASPFEVEAQAGSYGMVAGSATARGTQGNASWSANAGYDAAEGFRDRTAFSAAGLGASLAWESGASCEATFNVTAQNVAYEIPGWLTKAQMAADPHRSNNPDDRAENNYLNAGAALVRAWGDDRFEMNIAGGRTGTRSDMVSWMSYADSTLDTVAFSPRGVLTGSLFGRQNQLTLGVDLHADTLRVERFADESRNLRTVDGDIDRTVLGAYARNEWSWTPETVFGAGVRTETARVAAQVTGANAVDDDTTHAVNAVEASVTRTVGRSKVYARAGTVYRYPFVDEQVSYIGFGTDQFYSDIEPEMGWDAEIGAECRVSRQWSGRCSAFILDMTDEIAWNNMTYRNENLDSTRRLGAEAALQYAAGRYRVRGSYTFTQATFTGGPNDGHDIPLVPAHRVTVGAGVDLPLELAVDLTANYTAESYLGGDYANDGDRLEAHTVVDLVVRHVSKKVAGLEAFVAVENLLNDKYASVGYRGWPEDGYYPAPEVSVRTGVAMRF